MYYNNHTLIGVVAACLVLSYHELSLTFDLDLKISTISGARLGVQSSEPVPRPVSLIDASDKVLSTFSSIPIGRWDFSQVSIWLTTISEPLYVNEGKTIIDYIEQKMSEIIDENIHKKNEMNLSTDVSTDVPKISLLEKRKYKTHNDNKMFGKFMMIMYVIMYIYV